MDLNTGILFSISQERLAQKLVERVPSELEKQAYLKINRDGENAKVNLRGNTPLAKWAKKKKREKIAAQSKRRNRK